MQNPYSSPETINNNYFIEHTDALVEHDILKIKSGYKFPNVCPLCGKVSDQDVKERKVYFSPRWLWWVLLLNFLIYIALHITFRKSLIVTFGYCNEHRKSKNKFIIVGSSMSIFSILLMIYAGVNNIPATGIFGWLFMVIGIVLVILGNKSFRIIDYSDKVFMVMGVNDCVLNLIVKQSHVK